MKSLLPRLGLTFVLCLLSAFPLRGDTLTYPEDKPVFSVEAPDGWHPKREKGSLMLVPSTDAAVLFQQLTDVHDDAAAKSGLKVAAEKLAVNTFGLTGAEAVVPAGPMDVGTFKGFATEYKGKDKDGESTFWQCIAFAPEKGKYYLVTIICSDKDDKATAADRDAIVSSIKAVKE